MSNNMKQKVNCQIPIHMLTSTWKGEIKKLPSNKVFSLIIDYPVHKELTFKINTGSKGLTFTKLLQKIGKVYETIYKSKKYEQFIYGHDISDLTLEDISVDMKNKSIRLGIGS